MPSNQQIVLDNRPQGEAVASNFKLVAVDTPALKDGEVLVRNHYLSLDPYMRGRMNDSKSYAASQPLGEVMIGGTVGEVAESQNPKFAVGDKVVGMGGWQEYSVVDGNAPGMLRKVDTTHVPLSFYLGAVGMPGVTAWYGLVKIIAPKPGATVVVSAATGAVGSAFAALAKARGLRVVGIDCHIGSQITESAPYLEAMDRVLDLVTQIEAAGIPIHHIDFGGGLGIDYNGDTPPAADVLWQQLLGKLDARGFGNRKIMIEPGRSLVGNAGVCLTEVLFLKPGEQKNFCIVDAAMNDLPRPALYEAFHRIVPLAEANPAAQTTTYDVVGPVCESGDWLGRDRALAVQQGDVLAVLSAGAYCMSMASNYNTRPRAAEVLVDGSSARVIRQREAVQDLWRGESV